MVLYRARHVTAARVTDSSARRDARDGAENRPLDGCWE